MRSAIVLAVVVSLILIGAFGISRMASPRMEGDMTIEQLESYLMELDRQFDLATAARGIEGWVSYFAADGKMFPAGQHVVKGHAAIRSAMGPSFDSEGFSLRWEPVFADVSSSGDLGYTHGTYVVSYLDPEGNPAEGYGKYVSIWKKQPDGTWKVVVDLGTPSPAPEA